MDGGGPGDEDQRDATSELLERAKAGGDELAASAAGPRASSARREPSPWVRPMIYATVFALLGTGVAALLGGGDESPFVYSEMVDEVVADPGAHRDRTLRVEGQLQSGSVLFREDPCEWRFVIEREGRAMPVEFPQCVVPDTFRDGMGISVVVEGRLQENGTFHATQVIPRCPSRYEMEQRRQAGEAMPHAAPESS